MARGARPPARWALALALVVLALVELAAAVVVLSN
jgi:hypothetical protein